MSRKAHFPITVGFNKTHAKIYESFKSFFRLNRRD